MTFFRRLRRPIVLLLCSSIFVLVVYPDSVQAAYKIIYNAVKYGSRAAITLGRTGSFTRAANEIRVPLAAFRAMSTGEKVKYIAKEAVFAAEIGMVWNWIKKHPGDAADIGGALIDLVDALRGSGMPNTANAIQDALGGSGSSPGSYNVGDTMELGSCGKRRITSSEPKSTQCLYLRDAGGYWDSVQQYLDYMNQSVYHGCPLSFTLYTAPGGSGNCYMNDKPGHLIQQIVMKTEAIQDEQPSPAIPDSLTPDQERRLLDKIGEYLDSQKEQMERELDDLLKKNLNDIDWPKFDNDAAKKYLDQKRGQDLQAEIDKVQQELERRQQERQQQQQECQQNPNCPKCCDTGIFDESRLANRIDQLKDRLDDLNQRQEDDAVNQYDPPTISEVELKQIDFQPVVDLKGALMSKFPFNMLELIPTAFELLNAEPTAPYWDANLGEMGGTHRVSFSVLNSLASFIRLVLSWLCYIGAIFCCLKIWSRL